MNIAIITGAVSLTIWVYLLLGRGGFWRVAVPSTGRRGGDETRIVAVVPARNEADVIGRAVTSLLRQDDVLLRVIVVDDASTDGTAEVVRHCATDLGASERVEVITGKPLPEGWSGKLWAVQQGIEVATKYAPDFLLLTDADIEHRSDSVRALVEAAEVERVDLASYMVKLHCTTFPEKLLIPPFVFFFLKLYPPKWIADPHARTAGAAGGCMLLRPTALERAGGIAGIRGEIIDDCALAEAIKQSGGRVWLSMTEAAWSIRPYTTFSEIGRMVSRTAFNQLGHSSLLLLVAVLGLVFTYIAPGAVMLVGSRLAMIGGALAFALMMVAYSPMVRFYRLNPLWTLTLPVAAIFYMGATVHSAWRYWSGKGGQWKGRVQDRTGATHA
jgi:hopene-associated glycosyltransferase HpnB